MTQIKLHHAPYDEALFLKEKPLALSPGLGAGWDA